MTASKLPLLLSLLLTALPLAGCIELPIEGAGADAPADVERRDVSSPGEDDERMTAEETVVESEGVNPGPGLPPAFIATRVHTIEGVLALDALPVFLATSSGDVTVTVGEPGRWRLVATIQGQGVTPEMARENLARFTFAWAHEQSGEHFVQATVEAQGEPMGVGPVGVGMFAMGRGALALELPPEVAIALDVATSSGNVLVEGAHGSSIRVDTSSGNARLAGVDADDVDVDVSSGNVAIEGSRALRLAVDASGGNVDVDVSGLRDAAISSSSGNVDATLAPGESGSFDVGASSGNVVLRVPETVERGYSASASASSGEITITLADGRTSWNEDRDEAAFESTGYRSRDVRTTIAIETSSGNVRLSPA